MAFESMSPYHNTTSQRGDYAQYELDVHQFGSELQLERVAQEIVAAALYELSAALPHIQRLHESTPSSQSAIDMCPYTPTIDVDVSSESPEPDSHTPPSAECPYRIRTMPQADGRNVRMGPLEPFTFFAPYPGANIIVPVEDEFLFLIETSEVFWFPEGEEKEKERQNWYPYTQTSYMSPNPVQATVYTSTSAVSDSSQCQASPPVHYDQLEDSSNQDGSYSTPHHSEHRSVLRTIQNPQILSLLPATQEVEETPSPRQHHAAVLHQNPSVMASTTFISQSDSPTQVITLQWQAPMFGADITNAVELRGVEEDELTADSRPPKRRRIMESVSAPVTSNSENVPPQPQPNSSRSQHHPTAPASTPATWPWQHGIGCNVQGSNCEAVKTCFDEMAHHLVEVHRISKGKSSKFLRDQNGDKTTQKARTTCRWKGCSESLAFSSVAKHMRRFHIGKVGWVCGRCKMTVATEDKRAHERACTL